MKKIKTKITTHIWKKRALVIAIVCLFIYLFGLLNPVTGPMLRYPYIALSCGKKPIIASDFMTKSYATPDMKTYEPGMYNDKFYCIEQEAQSHGYRKSSAP